MVFPERWELMELANAVVKMVVKRQIGVSTVEIILRRWNFERGYVECSQWDLHMLRFRGEAIPKGQGQLLGRLGSQP